MKKIFAMVAVLSLICSQAFAVTYTVNSTEKFRDAQGNNKIRVQGTIAFDSAYPCNATTSRCGESIEAANLGMSLIDQMTIDPTHSTVANGVLLFRYFPLGKRADAGDGTNGPNIRAYYGSQGVAGITGGALVSAPSYDLSALTAVPFSAIGA